MSTDIVCVLFLASAAAYLIAVGRYIRWEFCSWWHGDWMTQAVQEDILAKVGKDVAEEIRKVLVSEAEDYSVDIKRMNFSCFMSEAAEAVEKAIKASIELRRWEKGSPRSC